MIAFVPAWAGIVFYGFYAVLAIVVFSVIQGLVKLTLSLKGLPNFLISATLAGLAVYCLLPRLWDYTEVNAVAKPGMPFSSVVEELGNPSWPDSCAASRNGCLLYTSPSPRDGLLSRMPSSA